MKYLLLKILLIFSLSVNNAYAVDVSLLDKDQPAPYKGYLFTEEKTLQIRRDLLEFDNQKSVIESYQRSINLYKANEQTYIDKTTILLQQNDKLAQSVYQAKSTSDLEKVGYFLLGALSIGLGMYLGQKTAN